MKHFIIILTLIASTISFGQSNYEKGMQKGFELWQNQQPVEASNLFERIASVETDNWLPSYWAAYINILISFGEKDVNKLSAQLKKAQDLINDATAISKENPEIMLAQALLHTAWIAYDGQTYGMQLSGTVAQLYSKAQELAPENPRVILNKAEWDMGSARFFGQDTSPYCKDVKKALTLFENDEPESPFHPKWGKERAEQILESCAK